MAGQKLARDQAGNIWDVSDPNNPRFVSQQNPMFANPKLPGELTSQSLSNQRTQQEIQQAQATAAATTEKTKAEATSAEIAAKNAQEAYDSAHPKGTTATVLGPDSLKALSPPDQEIVKALADGRLAFPAGFALKAPWWQQKLEQVAAYDPSFDATNFNNRAKARAMLLTGKVGTSANALNTAIGHVGLLGQQLTGTASHGPWSIGPIPIPGATTLNAIENSALRSSGQPGITNFQDTAQKLADELESVYRNGGGAEQGVVRQLRSLDPNLSSEQKQGIIRNALELLASKQAANLYQYNIGSGGKPEVDLLDPAARKVLDQYPDIRDKYFAQPSPGLSHDAAGLLQTHGGTPPSGPSAPSSGPQGGPPPIGPQGTPPTADYSGMVGGPQAKLAAMDQNSPLGAFQQTYRNQYDPAAAQGLGILIKRGRPYEEAAAFAQSRGFTPPDPNSYSQAVAFAKVHNGATNVNATRSVPTTLGQRLASSPAASFVAGAGNALTAGFDDEAAGGLSALTGGNYQQGRDAFNANKIILSATNPTADLLGNVAGGVGLGLGAEGAANALRLLPRAQSLLGASTAQTLGNVAPIASDAAYGGLYGTGQNNDNRLAGAGLGAVAGIGGGMFGRSAARTVGRMIAPDAGAAAPLYQAGVTPTIGQRAAAMTGPIGSRVGRAINVTEQALQSVPLLGALPAMARQGARNDFQTGAFNDALSNIGQQLPKGTVGTDAHTIASGAFSKAYDAARSGMQFVPDNQFTADQAAFDAKLNNGTLNADQIAQVQKRINTAVDSRLNNSPVLGGDAYKNAASELADTQRQWAQSDPLKAAALGDYLSIFDNAAKRNSNPAASAALDATDAGYAKLVRIQQASARGGAGKDPGTFSPTDYAGAVKQMGGGVRSNAYSRGNALGQDYAQAGLSLRDTLGDSGTAPRLATLGALQGAEGLGLAATGHLGLLANPMTLGMFAPYVGKAGAKMIAPREATLPPILANPLNLAGNGIYDRAGAIGRLGAPAALDYLYSQ